MFLLRLRLSFYALTTNKGVTVRDMFLLGLEYGGGVWQWRRRLWTWEEELVEECRELLLTVSLQDNSCDRWLWMPDPSGGYTVRGAYDMLTSQDFPFVHQTSEFSWHKQVPLKVSIFAWRLLRDRLQTRHNLAARGILPMDARLCLAGCGQVEDMHHLFLSCPFFGALWPLVRNWLGIEGVEDQTVTTHVGQFIHYAGGSRARRSFFHLIWLLCVWVLWKERNARHFRNTRNSLMHLFDQVKHCSLWWLKARNVSFTYGIHSWWSNPLVCLGIA